MVEVLVDKGAPITLKPIDLLGKLFKTYTGSSTRLPSGEMDHLHPTVGADGGPCGQIVEKSTLDGSRAVLARESDLYLD